MNSLVYSKLAEIYLEEKWMEDSTFITHLKDNATFEHKDSYEFIHHLYQDESEEWFVEKYMQFVPNDLKNIILEARRNGAARVCFYA
jgi:hypothetical protein